MILQIADNSLYLYGIIAFVVILGIALLIKGKVFSKITKGSWTLKTEDKTINENEVVLNRSNKNKIYQPKTGKNKVDATDSDENEVDQTKK